MRSPARLAAAGMVLLIVAAIIGFLTVKSPKPTVAPPPVTTTTTTTPSPPPPATTTPPAPPPPPRIAMSWSNAGAFIVNSADVDPTWLGQQFHQAGFGWVALYLGSVGDPQPLDPGWVTRFILASGLPVGGWTVLKGDPHADADFAATQLKANDLTFYIADVESSYQGQEFISRFRSIEPTMTAGLSSLCEADGVGLEPWAHAGFAFLPQAYVNDFGDNVAPAACVHDASAYFPLSAIHPTIGSYHGQKGFVLPQRYVPLLAAAGTTGFSVYNAETNMSAQAWAAYGQAIRRRHIAARAS